MIYVDPEGDPTVDGEAYVQRFKSNGLDVGKIRQFSIQHPDRRFLSREEGDRWQETKSWWPSSPEILSSDEYKIVLEAAMHAEFEYGLIYQLDFCDENYNILCSSRINWLRMGFARGSSGQPPLPPTSSPSPPLPPPPTLSPTDSPVKNFPPLEVSAPPPLVTPGIPSAGTIVICEEGHDMIREMAKCLWCGKPERQIGTR